MVADAKITVEEDVEFPVDSAATAAVLSGFFFCFAAVEMETAAAAVAVEMIVAVAAALAVTAVVSSSSCCFCADAAEMDSANLNRA